jgi:cytoskeletal protein CcmA (bactofilin family)
MPSTYTVNLGIEKPATGEQSGTWGDTTNVNFDILDQAINGAERVTLTSAGSSGSPNALIITNGAASDGRNKWIEFYSSGDLGGDVFVQLQPNDAEKIVFVRNSLAGGQSVLLFQGTYNSGRDLEISAGVDMVVKFDGGGASAANVTDVYNNLKVTGLVAGTADINGGTVDGTVIGGASAAALTATTVVANTSLNIAGDGATVTGIKDEDNMASNSATKLATQQSIKAYVDSQVGTVDTLSEILANGNTTGANDIDVDAAQKVQFRDAAIYINSSVDGQLDIVADTEIQIAATTIDINGAINASGEIIAASLDISGNVDVDGITNLDVVDIDGAVQLDNTLTVGVDDTGYDVKFYGATGGAYMLWDESADDLILAGAGGLVVAGNVDFNGDLDVDGTTNLDVVDIDGAVDMASTLGVTGATTLSSTLGVTGAATITSASATSLAVGLTGATNPAFTVDSSTASQVAGLKVTGAATGGTVAVVATDSGSNTNLTINAKGTGTIGIGSVSTGAVTITPATTINGETTISVSSTSDALRITQTGSGNALLVEDSANPDATPFVIDSGGNVIKGNDTAVLYSSGVNPQIQLNIAGAGTVGISRWSANTANNALVFLKSRGATIGDFTSVTSGDNLGSVSFYGADGIKQSKAL